MKETASGFGQLVGDHIRLARIEMTADAKSYVRDMGMLLVGGFILAAGYGLACIAAGLGARRGSSAGRWRSRASRSCTWSRARSRSR